MKATVNFVTGPEKSCHM